VTVVGELKLTELETGMLACRGRVGVTFSSPASRVTLVSSGMPNGVAVGGACEGEESGPPGDEGDRPMRESGMVGESPVDAPPKPSPPWVRTGAILRPEIF
jgi:hypothetical protein